MAGQLRFSLLNLVTSSTYSDKNRDVFTHIYNFFESHPGFQRIASYYGVGGTGFNFSNASDESGENAWVVWRNVSGSQTYDLIWRWSYSTYSTSGVSGSWTVGNNNYGVSWAVAFHSSSASFAGTTNNDGNDSFNNSNPWKSGSLVFPRQNMAGGISSGSQNMTHPFLLFSTSDVRVDIVGDNDSFVLLADSTDNNTWDTMALFERYIPFYPYSHPYFSYGTTSFNGLNKNTDLGGYATSVVYYGGISTTIDLTNEDNKRNLGVYIPRTSYQNLYKAPVPITDSFGQMQEWPYIVGVKDMHFGDNAPLGYLTLVRTSYQSLTSSDLLGSGSTIPRMVRRPNAPAYPTLTIPWTGSVEHLTGVFYSEPLVFMTGTFGMTAISASSKEIFAFNSGESGNPSSGSTTSIPVFRGENPPGTFVYSEGIPPSGATNVIIVGYTQ